MRAMGVVLSCGVSPSGRGSPRGCDMTALRIRIRRRKGPEPLASRGPGDHAVSPWRCSSRPTSTPASSPTSCRCSHRPSRRRRSAGARRSTGRMRSTWAALGPGCGGWAVGQAWWAHQEIAGAGIPFPSVADLGFVAFPVLAATALLLHPTDGGARCLWRRSSDTVMTTAAGGLVSWESALEAIADRAAEQGRLAGALFLAYPVLGVVLIVLAVLTAARTRQPRLPLLLVCAGLVALSVSDTVFAYLEAAGSYRGGAADLGWVAGFLLLALAGAARSAGAGGRAGDPSAAGGERTVAPLHADLLPYVPAVVALLSVLVHALAGDAPGTIDVVLATVVLSLILVRQFVALRENARLAGELVRREALLRHQAFHDGLTGLPNRGLLLDRLEHALALHRRDRRPVALLFLDLDGFKKVNDTLGHAAGDALLVEVAERLRRGMRSGDTVARLGGDEFAVLLESGADVRQATTRALGALAPPVLLDGQPVVIRASVGVSALGADDPPARADLLLGSSDAAMYAAKRAGGDRVVSYATGPELPVGAAHALRPPAPRGRS